MAADNASLGKWNFTGIAPAPKGVPQIEVTFDIDANGILSVWAKDLATGKQQKVTVTGSHRYSKDQIERISHETQATYERYQLTERPGEDEKTRIY